MRFELLGPVTARAEDGLVTLGPPKQRAVLAVLLLHANRVTPTDAITDLLWCDAPPRTARKTIQWYVWGLRQLLGTRLESAPPGYRLAVAREELDWAGYEDLVERARASRRARDMVAAAAHYARAESLWRGTALADVTGIGRLCEVAAPLDQLRISVYGEWIDVELELGRHAELLPRLATLVVEHPLHERFAGQHILALHRSGLRAQARAAYLRCRRTLERELGVEPGPQLRRLGEAIGARTATETLLRADPFPIRQLPPALRSFTGRGAELAALERLLGGGDQPAPRLCVVTGGPGVGKSALAVHAGHRLADRFADGQLYVNLCGATTGLRPLPPVEVLARFLRALGVPNSVIPTAVDEASALLRSLLADRSVLLVLDNAADADQVRPLVPAGRGNAVLVTARRAMPGLDDAHHLELGGLPARDALELLGRLAGAHRVDKHSVAVERLLAWLGGLPLAIRIAGARLAARPTWTAATLAERLADQRRRLAELRSGDVDVRSSFLVSYRAIDDDPAARLFRLLGVLDGPDLALPAVAALLDEPPAATQRALDELVEAHLLDEAPAGRYRMHDLIRLFARERADAEEVLAARGAALRRVLEFYLELTRWAGTLLLPGTRPGVPAIAGSGLVDRATALDWLEAERPNLVAAVAQATTSGDDHAARLGAALAVALFPFFHARGHVGDWMTVNRLGADAAHRLGDHAAEARLLTDLARAHFYVGQHPEAIQLLHDAMPLWRSTSDRVGQAEVLNQLAVLYSESGDPRRAESCLTDSLRTRPSSDVAGRASTQGNLAKLHELQGRYQEAVRWSRTSAALARKCGSPDLEANALATLGHSYCRLGRDPQGLRYLRRSLDIATDTKIERIRGGVLRYLAEHYHAAGQIERAITYAQQAARACHQTEYLHGEAAALRHLGELLHTSGDPTAGDRHLRRALDIFTALGAPEAADVELALAGRVNAQP